MTRRRTVDEQAPDEEELELLIHGDVDDLEALGWDVVVKRLILAGFLQPHEGPYTFIDWLATTGMKRNR